eukprot:m.145642 g.145642  ORF g.145642 m.145642 type:complete len:302 (+) comp52685_c0_seq1:26-931(+)
MAVVWAGSMDGVVRGYTWPPAAPCHTLTLPRPVRALHASPSHLAAACWDANVYIISHTTGEILHTLSGHTKSAWDVKFSPSHKLLASSGFDDRIILRETRSYQVVSTLQQPEICTRELGFSSDEKYILGSSASPHTYVWDLATGNILHKFTHTVWAWTAAVSPVQQLAVTGSEDLTMKLWDLDSGAMLTLIEGHIDMITSLAISEDGRFLISASGDHSVALWELPVPSAQHTQQPVWRVRCVSPTKVAISQRLDAVLVSSGPYEGPFEVSVFGLDGRPRGALHPHTCDIPALCFVPSLTIN